jgi:hypothetical protein
MEEGGSQRFLHAYRNVFNCAEYITRKLRFSTTKGERKINKRNIMSGAGNKGLKYQRERERERDRKKYEYEILLEILA